MKLAPGSEIGRYRVEAEIGRGGMARVYRVRHTTLDTLHALKVLTLTGEELRERLVREGRVQAQLDHPNVVPVRDILDLEQGPGLLMDFIDGPSLDAWLLEHDPDAAERERIFSAIATGVGFAHDHGIVHRDLKPGNVMMQLRHGKWMPRVADFGLAKLVSGDEGDAQLQSRTGRPMGTPAYMAPEQVRSAKHVDARADVFALGCILYELYCGRRAFVGSDSLELFNRITQGSYLPPRQAALSLEPRVEQAIFGALAVQPDERIPDCATLLAVLRGEQVWELPSPSPETFFGDFGAPPRAPNAMPMTEDTAVVQRPETSSTLAPASLDGTLTSAPGFGDGSLVPPPDPPKQHSSGRPAWMWASAGGVVALLAVAVLGRGGPDTQIDPTPVLAEPAAPVPSEPAPVEVIAEPLALEPPAPAPQPAKPVAVPSPATPAPAVVRTKTVMPSGAGRVEVTGDAKAVRFRGSGGQVAEPGDLQPGSYIIEAAFEEDPPMHAGNLEVRAGQTVYLRCSSETSMCSP